MINRNREKGFSARLSEEEHSMFQQLAFHFDNPMGKLLRQWIRTEWEKIFGEKGEKE